MSALEAEYLTVSEAAALLRVAPSTIRRWIRAGQISAYRLGPRRIALRRAELARLVSQVIPDRDGMEMPPAGGAQNGAAQRQHLGERRLTAEEVQRGLKALEDARRLNAEIMAERGNKPYMPSSAEVLYEMREDRMRQLTGE